MRAVGMTGKTQPEEQQLQATQPAESPPGTGLKTNGHQLAGLAAKKQQLPDERRSLSRRAVQVDGGSAVGLAARKAGADLPTVPSPPNAFACQCLYPLP